MCGVDFANGDYVRRARLAKRAEDLDVLAGRASVGLPDAQNNTLPDGRFRALIGPEGWTKLSDNVRARFSKKVREGGSVVYTGIVTDIRMSRLGWLFSQVTRLIGGPLPIDQNGAGGAAVVSVTEDASVGGQFWTRAYGRPQGFPQVIHSSKRFQGPTGLEEYVGFGIGMTSRVSERHGNILFVSDRYYVELPWMRLYLPRWLSPGHLEAEHHALGPDRFAFTLKLTHPVFGELLFQRAEFEDAHHCPGGDA